jgi:hypothetical protein
MVLSMVFPKGDLIETKRLVSEARDRLGRQRELVLKLAAGGYDTNDAEALFRALRRNLEEAEARHRRFKAADRGRSSG